MRVQSGEKCLSCILNLKITKAIEEVVSGSIWVVRTVMSQLQTLISRGTRPCCLVEQRTSLISMVRCCSRSAISRRTPAKILLEECTSRKPTVSLFTNALSRRTLP